MFCVLHQPVLPDEKTRMCKPRSALILASPVPSQHDGHGGLLFRHQRTEGGVLRTGEEVSNLDRLHKPRSALVLASPISSRRGDQGALLFAETKELKVES